MFATTIMLSLRESNSDNTPYEKIGDEVRSLADEVPFDIPDSWEWVRLGELFQHNTGKALNASNRTGQLKQYITTSNLYWDRFELDNLKEMHFSDSEVEKYTAPVWRFRQSFSNPL